FRAAMRAHGLRVPGAYVAETPLDEEGGLQATQRLLALDRPPSALVAWSLAAAVGALAAARRAGVSVPRELSVVGFHDAPIAAYLDPPLTTVRMPLGEMAERSVETLIRIIEGERVENLVIESPPVLVPRGSTAVLDTANQG